jgi:hypothetical protein
MDTLNKICSKIKHVFPRTRKSKQNETVLWREYLSHIPNESESEALRIIKQKCQKYINDFHYMYMHVGNLLVVLGKRANTYITTWNASKYYSPREKIDAHNIDIIAIFNIHNGSAVDSVHLMDKVYLKDDYLVCAECCMSMEVAFYNALSESEVQSDFTGLWIKYYDSGGIDESRFYLNGQRIRDTLWLDERHFFSDSVYVQDTKYIVKWHGNGYKLSEEKYINGKKSGTFTYWSKNGKKFNEKCYSDDVLTDSIYY